MENGTVLNSSANEEQAEEMPATERDLVENAAWKQIQKNTFTRWCNEHLKCVNKSITNLESDFSDGLRLISLLEVLSHKHMKKYNKRPNFRQMRLENVSVALNFMESENMRLVSIDSKAIVDGNLKLILGLVWTLILNYSISMPIWDEETEQEQAVTQTTPKQRLFAWIQNKIPEMPITNFKKNWNDGKALGALVDNCAPGLCPDWEDWDPNDGVKNAEEAMKLADEWLGVPMVITPEEITNPDVDDLSVMTYLSEFPKAQLKEGAPLRPRTNAKKARAYGKGIEPNGCKAGFPAKFTVETFGAGNGEVVACVTHPNGNVEEIVPPPNNDRLKTYSVSYNPKESGSYEVSVLFAGSNIQKSPFIVNVEDCPSDPSKVTAKGAGLNPGNVVGKPTSFEVCTEGAGPGDIKVEIDGPTDKVPTQIDNVEDNVYVVTYTPIQNGPHEVSIKFQDSPIPNSPCIVPISYPLNPNEVWAEGPGVEPEGLVMNKTASFVVHAEKAGDAKADIKCIGPRGVTENVSIKDNGDGTYLCQYKPSQAGQHVLSINYGGKPCPDSPYRVNVDFPSDPTKVTMEGPGLDSGSMVGVPTYFDVFTDGCGKGDVKAELQSKDSPTDSVAMQLEDRGDGTTRCHYTPNVAGAHQIKITFDNQPVPDSPCLVNIVPAYDASACRAYGRGIQSTGLRMREKAEFHVTTEGAGDAELRAFIRGAKGGSGEPVIVRKNPLQSQKYDCEYFPLRSGEHKLDVTYGGKHIPKSPFKITIGSEAGPQKVRAFGPGLISGKVDKPADFVVEYIEEATGKLGFFIEGPSQAKIDCIDKGDGSCDVSYHPTSPGEYAVHVTCDNSEIKGSPFMAQITPAHDNTYPENVIVFGPGVESGTPVNGERVSFKMDTSNAGGSAPVGVVAQADGEIIPVAVEQVESGVYELSYTPKKATKHTIIPTYDDVAVKNSPFRVDVLENSYPDRVKVYGPGVGPNLRANEATHFTVDCTNAGRGDVVACVTRHPDVQQNEIEEISCDVKKVDDDTYVVTYTPVDAGDLFVEIYFADQEISASPVQVHVSPSHDASRVWVEGPGLYSEDLVCGYPTQFSIFTWEAGKAKPEVKFSTSKLQDPVKEFQIKEAEDSSYSVSYTPRVSGEIGVQINYGGDPIPGSPFRVNILSPLDLSKVQVVNLKEKLEVGRTEEFQVETLGAGGKGVLDVSVSGPDQLPVSMNKKELPHGTKFSFIPVTEGLHKINVKYDGLPIADNPFIVKALIPPDSSKVRAYGPGLSEGVVRSPATFTVDTQDTGNGDLGVTVEGPCEAEIQCTDKGDGTCAVTYLPIKAGTYKVNVLYDNQHVPGSPFNALIDLAFDASKVKVIAGGAKSGKVGELCKFEVDCRKAGNAILSVDVIDEDGENVPLTNIKDNGDRVHNVAFLPVKPGKAEVRIKYGDEPVPGSPLRIPIKPDIDVSRVKCSGPGVQNHGVFVDVETCFAVDASYLAPADEDLVSSRIVGSSGTIYPVHVKDNLDGTYDGRYTSLEQGPHHLYVNYNEIPVPGSPFSIAITEGCDPSKVKAFGLGLEKGFVDSQGKFSVDTRGAGVGSLGLAVEGPCNAKITCTDKQNGTCAVEYLPTSAGDYQVVITYGGQEIPGSPFDVKIKDIVHSDQVRCSGSGLRSGVRAEVPQKFKIDCTEAGKAPLKVVVKEPDGETVDVDLNDNENGTYVATYTPTCDGPHQIQVKYGDEEIPQSPYRVLVLPKHDASKVICNGPGLSKHDTPATLPTQFYVDASNAGEAPLSIDIHDSSGRPCKADIFNNSDKSYTIQYVPDKVDTYTISVKYGGDDTPLSPYRVQTVPSGDASKCEVFGDGLGPLIGINEEGVISIDPLEEAGPGKVRCNIVGPNGKPLDCEVVENKDGTFDVFYTPRDEGPHSIDLTYGGEKLPDSLYVVKATSGGLKKAPIQQDLIQQTEAAPAYSQMNGSMPKYVDVDGYKSPKDDLRNVKLEFELPSRQGEVTSVVTTPSGRKNSAYVRNNGDGTVTIDYQPDEVGLHEMGVFLDDEHITGSPIQFYADLISGHVTAYGPGLVTGKVNKPANFTVVTKDVQSGGLALAIEGPSKAEIICEGNKDGTCSVSYLPTAPGKYLIAVKFDEKHIPGSPYCAYITDPSDQQKSKLTSGKPSKLSFKINEADLSLLTATVHTPSGQVQECSLKKIPHGHVAISFTPKEVGEHVIDVKKRGRHIKDSPFRVMVDASEMGDASKVKVHGEGCEKATAKEMAEFIVDSKVAGYGALGLSIEGPSKVDIHCEDLEPGMTRVNYTPQEPGNYIINVKFADKNVPGSPFEVVCSGKDSPKKRIVTKHQKAAPVAKIGSVCNLNLTLPAIDKENIVGEVESPNGEKYPAEIVHVIEDTYNVCFTPKEMGQHIISVTHLGEHVPGSPFKYTVGPLSKGGARNVTASGPGLEKATANTPAEFNVWTHEGGEGGLAIAVEGPSKAEITYEDTKDGSCGISYVVSKPGDYEVLVKFNDENIPGSPFPVTVHPGDEPVSVLKPKSEAFKVRPYGTGLRKAMIGDNNNFILDCSEAGSNLLLVGVQGPRTPCEEVNVKHIGGKKYAVTYSAQEPGKYLLVIKWGTDHVPGSPFHLTIP